MKFSKHNDEHLLSFKQETSFNCLSGGGLRSLRKPVYCGSFSPNIKSVEMSTGNIYGCGYHYIICSSNYIDKSFPCTCGFFILIKIGVKTPKLSNDRQLQSFRCSVSSEIICELLVSHRPAYQPQHNFLNFIPKALLHFSTNQEISTLFFLLRPYIILNSLYWFIFYRNKKQCATIKGNKCIIIIVIIEKEPSVRFLKEVRKHFWHFTYFFFR